MELIKKLYKDNAFFHFLLHPVKKAYDFYNNHLFSDVYSIRVRYKKSFGVYPDLENPKTLNEKMQWLKLYDRTPLHTMCADKYKVREYVAEKVGEQYLVPLVFSSQKVEDISSHNLPGYPVAVKTNHDSGGAEIIRNKAKVNYKKLQKKIKERLNVNYFYRSKEWQYKNITAKIIVEKLLLCSDGKIPNDYKFHCFHGEPKVVYVSVDREGKNKRNIYDINWIPLFFTWAAKEKDIANLRGEEIPKPENYEKMIELAKKLSSPFKYVRVDLYNAGGAIYFGEMTFHQGSGFEIISPKEWDEQLGSFLDITA